MADLLSPAEKAELARQNAQCLLVNNLPDILAYTGLLPGGPGAASRGGAYPLPNVPRSLKGFKTPGYSGDLQKTLCHIGSPDKLVNALTADLTPPKAFVHATPAQLSQLQPRVDFYIRSNESTNAGVTTPTDRKIIFSDYVSGEKMTKLQSVRDGTGILDGSSEGWNVGLKEFSWIYDNKHEGDKIVKAKMIMYFGSLAELTNNYYLDFLFVSGRSTAAATGAENETDKEKIQRLRQSLEQRKKELKAGTVSRSPTATHRDARQLKVILGWALPPRKMYDLFEDATQADNFYQAVKQSQRTLLLNLTQYDLNFNQNGSVEITLEYIASSDAYMVSPQADVLADHRDNRSRSTIPTGRSGISRYVGGTGRLSELYPDGYIYKTLRSALNSVPPTDSDGVEVFGITGTKVLAEIDFLDELAQLYSLTLANNTDPKSQEKVRLAQQWLEGAEAVYADYLAASATDKYQSFLLKLIGNGRCFRAVAKSEFIRARTNQSGPPPKYYSLEGGISSLKHGATEGTTTSARKRMRRLAGAIAKAKQDGITAQEYLDGDGSAGGSNGIINPDDPAETSLTTQELTDGKREILFVRLGDLIQVATDSCLMPPETQIVLGSFSPREARMRGFADGELVCLAELPISLDYFGQWFFDHVISADRDVYPFRRFLDDLINDLINPILNELCSPNNTRLTAAYTNCVIAATDSVKINISSGGISTDSSLIPIAQLAAEKASTSSKDEDLITLILIHAEQVNDERIGNRTTDEKEGIYHFFLGADRGLVKEFNFSQKQMPQLRAMNIEKVNEGASKAGILILPMDVSLRMFGNSLLRNGNMIYVNANYGVGQRVADSLKLGGYYRVYKSTNTIRPGFFETTVDCIFERPRINPAPRANDQGKTIGGI
jgi:hypothetical protein